MTELHFIVIFCRKKNILTKDLRALIKYSSTLGLDYSMSAIVLKIACDCIGRNDSIRMLFTEHLLTNRKTFVVHFQDTNIVTHGLHHQPNIVVRVSSMRMLLTKHLQINRKTNNVTHGLHHEPNITVRVSSIRMLLTKHLFSNHKTFVARLQCIVQVI